MKIPESPGMKIPESPGMKIPEKKRNAKSHKGGKKPWYDKIEKVTR